jgi:hypothetical protein
MKKNILVFSILISGILTSGAIINFADAEAKPLLQPQEQKMPGDIQYPIPELGNCTSKSNCKIFCDNSKNSDACLAFAEKRNLMSPEELANARKFKDSGMVGPGGCKGQTACEEYCGISAHMEECVSFAEENGMMSDQQLQESKKVLAAIKNGIKPPACNGPKECEQYCGSPSHMEECMTFSLAAGIAPDDQKEQMQKTLEAIKKGVKPPACRGPEECDQYCSLHMEECMNFSLASGMVPEDQKEQMQKTLEAFKKGIKPPACQPNDPPSDQAKRPNKSSQAEQGLQKCDQYCADPSHIDECVKFSVAVGNMTEEQAQRSLKTGGKGPGGCIGKDACEAFCNNPDNEETCFNFGKDNGMIPQEDLQRMQEGQQRMKDTFSSIPPEVLDCLTSVVGADVVEKMKTGSMVGRKYGDSINQCFQKSKVEERPRGQDLPDQDKPEESDQRQPRQQGDRFQPGPGNINPGGEQMPQQAGPGGCKGPEECQKYCASNPEVCNNFQPPQNGQVQQNQPGQILPQQPQEQFNQPGPGQPGPDQPGQIQPGEPNPLNQLNQLNQPNPLNQPNQINQPGQEPGQFIQGQPGQMEPQQPLQPQSEQQPMIQQQNPLPPSPTSFLQGAQNLLANVLDTLR